MSKRARCFNRHCESCNHNLDVDQRLRHTVSIASGLCTHSCRVCSIACCSCCRKVTPLCFRVLTVVHYVSKHAKGNLSRAYRERVKDDCNPGKCCICVCVFASDSRLDTAKCLLQMTCTAQHFSNLNDSKIQAGLEHISLQRLGSPCFKRQHERCQQSPLFLAFDNENDHSQHN